MSRDALDHFFDDFKERFRQLVRETVAEELDPLRDMLLRPAGEAMPEVSDLVDVTEIARLLGEDVSTEKAKCAAAQKVYDLARRQLIPSVRVSPRRVRFDLAAVESARSPTGASLSPTRRTGTARSPKKLAPPLRVDYCSRPSTHERRNALG